MVGAMPITFSFLRNINNSYNEDNTKLIFRRKTKMSIEKLIELFGEAEKIRDELIFSNEETLRKFQEKLEERRKKS